MSKEWKEFWRSTLSYFTLDGYGEACSRVTPAWLEWLLEKSAAVLGLTVAIILALCLFPFVMGRMIWLTPKRFRITVLGEHHNG